MADAPCVELLWGDDAERIDAAVAATRARLFANAAGMEAFNHEVFDAPYTEGMGPVVAACKQLPMMMPQRLVELSGPEAFGKHTKDATPADKSMDRLIAYIEDPCPGTLLLIRSGGLRANSRLVKAVQKSPVGAATRFKAPANEREAVDWLRHAAAGMQVELHGAAAHELVRRVGFATPALRAGLERARAHAGRAMVRVADVEAVVEMSREVDVFALTDAIGACDHGTALRLLAAMFSRESETEKVFSLMGLLVRHVRLLYTAQSVGVGGLDLPPFIARKYEAQVQNFDARRLQAAFVGLSKIDAQIKGGTRDRYVASRSALLVLQRWVLDTCGVLAGTPAR